MKKLFILLAFVLGTITSFAQKSSLYNATNTYSLTKLQAATAVQDTVTNTGNGALYSKIQNGDGYITIEVDVQKVSGTVAGTITLLGSLGGASYDTIRTEETRTKIAAATLKNASGTTSYQWRLKKSPYLYYQVSTTGGTTCVYYLTGYILKHGLGN